ncbi:L-arabinose isomerase [Pseudobacter ginsenosidimutans]|uniref:L-arabinose isomerase n=1 Tax=Pseudobacter ginsenosidimutans TaxID=661488 RepID=A0A4Q7MGA1_9BACT|nr:L-arabinose isomerase [Pseudobacter ginsenosidimutans]QEC45174.1 L-arabinose isomerase [Pseudobacter ginsenosidimutans]RZS65439.1 L-arabinose isomerase [Pseudobacter ginsenosidimutans]
MSKPFQQLECWFVTGSQHLYGEATLKQVAEHAQQIAGFLGSNEKIPVTIIYKPVVKTPEEISQLCIDANSTKNCIGLITWMHTFSPAKMWIQGLKMLQKPLLHLHTQFNREIPWNDIDMDFMNLNQSAHGDREFGFIMSRMRLERKVVTGFWQDEIVLTQLDTWLRAAAGWHDWQGAKFVRFGDNMRYVAVTEGDKVEAEMKFGYSVNTHGVGDLVQYVNAVDQIETDLLCQQYADEYKLAATLKNNNSLQEAAKIEIGLRRFLEEGNFKGFTTTFEDLHGLKQLPGLAVQRLMKDGYGFGAEGDWKTAALVRLMKTMATGLKGGNSFMEDYTYHFAKTPGRPLVLGAHMLEICPSIAAGQPACEIHPLGIGGKADPVRLVFNAGGGDALNASVIDMGNRFRLLVNEVRAVAPENDLPKLPVARVLWEPYPDINTACTAWILAGGAHHTCFSQNLTVQHLEDLSLIAGMELILIDKGTNLRWFRNELRWNDCAYNKLS